MANRSYQIIQGRSVNLANSMARRSPIFNQDKSDVSPFSGYQINPLSDRMLSTSNVWSDGNDMKKAIKEEVQRIQIESKKALYTIQAQINDLKEKFNQSEKNKDQNQRKEQMISNKIQQECSDLVVSICEANNKDIKLKFKELYSKSNEQLKKEVFTLCQRQYAPLTLVDDLISFEERINQIEARKSILSNKSQPMISSQQVQSKLNKFQRQTETFKKQMAENQIQMNKLYFSLQEFKSEQKSFLDTFIQIRMRLTSIQSQHKLQQKSLQQTRYTNGEVLNLQKTVEKLSESFELLEKTKEMIRLRTKDGKISTYMVDTDGYVMDENGKYLTNQDNSMIKLTPAQIKQLSNTNQFSVSYQ